MTGMLIKGAADAARSAVLAPARKIAAPAPHIAPSPAPDPRDVALAGLRDEIAKLEERLAAQQATWNADLAAAKAAARQDAARDLQRDDARRTAALEQALQQARLRFESDLADRIEPLAARLAASAMRRLIALTQDEADWLGRVIARRLDDLARASVVSLHVAPGDLDQALVETLGGCVPDGDTIRADGGVAPGTARILLTLGEIAITPAACANDLVDMLEQAGTADD